MTNNLRIVFMGTPDFATSALSALVDAGMNIVGVFTKPDTASGRGMKPRFSDVKKYALEKDLTYISRKPSRTEHKWSFWKSSHRIL